MTGFGKNDEVGRLLGRALAVRRVHWGPEIRFSAPSFKHFQTKELESSGEPRFAAISVTGGRCALGCEHCKGVLLRSMAGAESLDELRARVENLHERGCRGLLVSGGCDREGRIPLAPMLPTLGELRRELGLTLAVHVGLADGTLAKELAAAGVDRVMLDLVGDHQTAREVLHLDAPPDRFEETLSSLTDAGLAVVPHIVVGLHAGELRGERRALEMATRYPVDALVMVVLRPEPGTPFEHVAAPSPETVAGFLAEARIALPTTPLHLGCARPLGHDGRDIEVAAVRAGYNGVAFPADFTVRLARSLGFEPTFAEQCCAM